MDNNNAYDRYHRQVILKNFGTSGQEKLSRATVLMVGAGGLGCPALQYLVAAGVGTIGIVDDDVVSLHNLHRQVLYSMKDIGSSKAIRAAEILFGLNPGVQIIPFAERLTPANAFEILEPFDIIIDGTDNFASRYLVNDACILLDKILVYGAVSEYEGQVAVFNQKNEHGRSVNYRDLFPEPLKEDEVKNCAEAGVLGVLPGIIGTMQAAETIKLITGIGEPLVNKLLTYNSLDNQLYIMELQARENTRTLIPVNKNDFENTNYEMACVSEPGPLEIDASYFDQLVSAGNTEVIDVREWDEIPLIEEFQHHKIPFSQLPQEVSLITADTIVTVCQSGKRSLQAARQLTTVFGTSKRIYSLHGGIVSWKKGHKNNFNGQEQT